MDNETMKILNAYNFAKNEAEHNGQSNPFISEFFSILAGLAEVHLNSIGIDPEIANKEFYGEEV